MKEMDVKGNAIKRIVYAHYQKFERDGSYVHVTKFSEEFGVICQREGIEFTVLAPPLVTGIPGEKSSFLGNLKSKLAKYYLSDIKAFVVQVKRMFSERRQLKELNPDIVLTRFDYNTFSIIWACRSLNIPVVVEINSPDHEERETDYWRVPGAENFFSSTRALSLCNGGFAVSDVLVDEYKVESTSGLPIHSIPNGVTIEQFDPQLSGQPVREQFDIAKDEIVIGFVGSFAPWHRMDMLFDSFSYLIQQGHPVRLLLVGQIKSGSEESVIRANQPDIKDHVTFSGFVASKDIDKYLAVMDITVLQNSAYYCSPLKMFEYMAMETAVLSLATEPVKEMLEDGEEGLLFPPGDGQAMTESLVRLVKDAELRQKLGQGARARMVKEFTWRHNAEKVYDLLEEVYDKSDKASVS